MYESPIWVLIIPARSPGSFQVWILLTGSEYRGWFSDLLSRSLGFLCTFTSFQFFCFLFYFTPSQFIYVWQPQSSIYQFSKICLAECPFYHSSLKSVLQSFYFPPELLSKPSRELACKNREFSHCFDERCYITTQQDYCPLLSFILVALTDLLCIVSAVAFFSLNFIHCCGNFLSLGTSDRC